MGRSIYGVAHATPPQTSNVVDLFNDETRAVRQRDAVMDWLDEEYVPALESGALPQASAFVLAYIEHCTAEDAEIIYLEALAAALVAPTPFLGLPDDFTAVFDRRHERERADRAAERLQRRSGSARIDRRQDK
jgi:hypothetical protein